LSSRVLLLCSASPRRRELLAGLGLRFEVVAPEVDESPRTGEPAEALAGRLARDKAHAGRAAFIAARARAGMVGELGVIALAADTVVARGGEILGKPRDRADARRMLSLLSGGDHSVFTGVCTLDPRGERSCVVETRVRFRALSEEQLSWLADSGDGDDKAGAYAVQGLGGAFVERIEGSVSNVVGLPLAEVLDLLAGAGVAFPWTEGSAR
jgi:septum formation protein